MKYIKSICSIFFAMMLLESKLGSCQKCLDDNNKFVDWFVIYKIPMIKGHSNPLIEKGLGYAWMSSVSDQQWTLSSRSINDSESMPGLTLAPLYHPATTLDTSQDSLTILYNDQPPVGNVSLTGGHTKGVVFATEKEGFWLVHSVPKYPPLPSTKTYSYPHSGMKNGQSYLCITLPADQLESVGTLLMYNDPHIYHNVTPAVLKTLYPQLTEAAHGSDVHSPPWYHSQNIHSFAGTPLVTFAKAPDFKKDLYSDWVVAVLGVDLLVETWPNGRGRLNSSCRSPHRVENVDDVKVSVVGQSFSSHKDHSKWAVSEDKARPWVCIGDINRATTQALRGGGTVCLQIRSLWEVYFASVAGVEACPKSHHN